ncbi:hypothetical protein TVAG_137280 [Trichomonas vaginalis G3]|uniref:CENP-T/Histone H4 histone fold domain-containing protein n=1 Tax=Trichomonas vaginalis (strain ATCC PRA-98 / G3) TaxID=412133 RepID=A2FNT0_TRIV3|nr:histone, subunit A domain-containing protein [Trichomonas vaginalis G3]EAX93443.1 hypothetical protein TVAG_137280 [Trichomonas vaginalis G3]KAI5521031.1 histone, subunit A domain-containing protein [Trichomonas vaginalis G3]|eukprot:XP_001306373.1 hypothetical protein [Trichomonas vaginalis G3]
MIDQYVNQPSQEERQSVYEKSIFFSCQKIVQKKTNDKATSSYINCLSSLVSQYITQIMVRDLVDFAKHAGRKEITVDDVILLSRKMPKTYQHLQEYKEKHLGITSKPKKSKNLKNMLKD